MISDEERSKKLIELRVKLVKECSDEIPSPRRREKPSGVTLVSGTIHGKDIVIPDVDDLLKSFEPTEEITPNKQLGELLFQGRTDERYFKGRTNLNTKYNKDMDYLSKTTEKPDTDLFKNYMKTFQQTTPPYHRVDRLKEILERYKADPLPHLSPAARWYGLLETQDYFKNPVPGGSSFVPQSPTRMAAGKTESPAVAVPGEHTTDPFVVVPIDSPDKRPIRFGSKRWNDMVHGSTALPSPEKSNQVLRDIRVGWTEPSLLLTK
eukprot:TRINITY_DN20947_c0_g1_i1.p1 TRINITY_DN20947_c0_g1~~TRINITY_DN20947_c0_g1_i1.p1  ORF type:complete len:264 (+),score=34.56 TRINITY_DN20947_c0_g1_i1:35-826(+)